MKRLENDCLRWVWGRWVFKRCLCRTLHARRCALSRWNFWILYQCLILKHTWYLEVNLGWPILRKKWKNILVWKLFTKCFKLFVLNFFYFTAQSVLFCTLLGCLFELCVDEGIPLILIQINTIHNLIWLCLSFPPVRSSKARTASNWRNTEAKA